MSGEDKGMYLLAVGFGAIAGIAIDRMIRKALDSPPPSSSSSSMQSSSLKATFEQNKQTALEFLDTFAGPDTKEYQSDDVTATENYSCCPIGTARELYASNHSSPLSGNLIQLEQETRAQLNQGFMLSGAIVGNLLASLARMNRTKRFLEIGTYSGFSALSVAEGMLHRPSNNEHNDDVHGNDGYTDDNSTNVSGDDANDGGRQLLSGSAIVCVDDFSDEPESKNVFLAAIARCPTRVQNAIQILEKPGVEALASLVGQAPFDLVFIDADKENQINYYEYILTHDLLSANGIICVDNTLWYSRVLKKPSDQDHTTGHINAFNEYVRDDPRTHVVLVPVRDGLTIITRA